MTRPNVSVAASELGRRGGLATAAKMTPEERKAKSSNAAHARWAKRKPDWDLVLALVHKAGPPLPAPKPRALPKEGTLNARVLQVFENAPLWKVPKTSMTRDQVLKELSSETPERVSNALSSLRTAGHVVSEGEGKTKLWRRV